ncbi:MAG: histidine phosphatase family protein [Dehalococcoidia bacterium]|nr:histidine phosphatase family protein [Dehalococcoidia bacterium]
MASIILIRHGQTEWNREARFRGRVDIDLDETGAKQAEAAAERIAQWKVAAIYSSPQKRAIATAEVIAKRLGLTVEPLDGIDDMDFGRWQGLSIAEVEEKYPKLFDLWRHSPERLRIPDGESMEDVQRRVIATIDDLVARHENETVVLISHRVVCKVLLCSLLGLDNSHFWQIAQDATAINLFEISGGRATVILLNDTCHLRAL